MNKRGLIRQMVASDVTPNISNDFQDDTFDKDLDATKNVKSPNKVSEMG